MKNKITMFLAFAFLFVVVVSNGLAEDKIVEQIKNMTVTGFDVKVGAGLDKAFSNGGWTTNGNQAIFKGKVKPNSVFPAEEKDTFYDMQYSTTEETQFQGTSAFLYDKYIKDKNDDIKKKAGYDNKRFLDSEKYYNIMDILDSEATGSDVEIIFTLSDDGKNASIKSYNAPKLYIHNESIRDLSKFLFSN